MKSSSDAIGAPRNLPLSDRPSSTGTPLEFPRMVESLRRNHQRVDAMALPANQEVVLKGIRGNAMELIAEVTTQTAPMVELNVLRSPNKEEFTRIAFFRERGYLNPNSGRDRPNSLITIDSSYSSILPDARSRAPETAPVFIEPDEPLKLRVFVDLYGNSIAFLNQSVDRSLSTHLILLQTGKMSIHTKSA